MTATGAGQAALDTLRRHGTRLATLAVGLVLGAAAGLYIHRWWGHGMFETSTIVSVVAGLLIAGVVVAATGEGLRGHQVHAVTGFVLSAALIGGALAGAALGPAYSPAASYQGTVTVHATAPVTADWTGTGYCWIDANESDVGGLWLGTWTGPGRPTEGSFGFTETGAPAFSFGRDWNRYDLFGQPLPRVEVRAVAPRRLAGEVAFAGMPTRGSGLLEGHPGEPIDGTVSWSCDPSRPAR